MPSPQFIEWLGSSHYSFTEAASSPSRLIQVAAQKAYLGLGLADRQGLYGVVQALQATQELPQPFFFAPGIRLHFDIADPLFIYPLRKSSYSKLCSYLSTWALQGMSHTEKGLTPLRWHDFKNFLFGFKKIQDDFVIFYVSGRFYPWIHNDPSPSRVRTGDAALPTPSFSRPPSLPGQVPFSLMELREICGGGHESALSIVWPLLKSPGIEDYKKWLLEINKMLNIPLASSSLPLFAHREDQDLCDLLTAIRHTKALKDLGYLRQSNHERRLLAREELQVFYDHETNSLPHCPFLRSVELKERHNFSLVELKYKYPSEYVPTSHTPQSWLQHLTLEGAKTRYPNGVPSDTLKQIEYELELISELKHEDYFLTLWDVLEYARSQKILFQGRGSAANSAVCYCLGITAIDPIRMNLLFERFISRERGEPPDIDIDFEHERREEVMQEVYRRYGRHRAAMVSTVICFRDRMAFRETAKAFGYSTADITKIIKFMGRERLRNVEKKENTPALELLLKELNISPQRWKCLLHLTKKLKNTPRHMGLHTGGFVLSSGNISEECIVEPARMENRSVIPWDKDDIDFLKWMKVDLLSLGMLTTLRKCFDLIGKRNITQKKLDLATIPQECSEVFKALHKADTVGVFQIESRAQMNMLPRLAPKNFYDIVVEVAIVRPGPLQGGMVHPYLRRRQKLEPITYDHPALIPILGKTLGVPIFQEQVMKIAVAVGGFTPGEADQMRKVMSGAWRNKSKMSLLKEKLVRGLRASGLKEDVITRIYKQVEGFGEYGFPESHSASFSLLSYASAWMKVHHPAEFLCALLNSQPMGFYSPYSLISDAKRHGVEIRPFDLTLSGWDHRLESVCSKPAVRLGFRLVQGFKDKEAEKIEFLQKKGILTPERFPLPSFKELLSLGLQPSTLRLLIEAGAYREELSAHDKRREQLWKFLELKNKNSNQQAFKMSSPPTLLPKISLWESLITDFQKTSLTLGQHPAQIAREQFFAEKPWSTSHQVYSFKENRICYVLGLLSVKQRPPTGGGIAFLTLEDEEGFFNLTLLPEIYEKFRLTLQTGTLLCCAGRVKKSWSTGPDPYHQAVSLEVIKLWNPFLRTNFTEESLKDKDLKLRDWG